MLRSTIFSKATAYTGALANAVAFGFYVPTIGTLLWLISVVFVEIWHILIAQRLSIWRGASQEEIRIRASEEDQIEIFCFGTCIWQIKTDVKCEKEVAFWSIFIIRPIFITEHAYSTATMDESSATGTREPSTITPHNTTIDACGKEVEALLKADFHFDTVQVVPFSAGSHWISIPLKMIGGHVARTTCFSLKW
jgi:hypothetical protein